MEDRSVERAGNGRAVAAVGWSLVVAGLVLTAAFELGPATVAAAGGDYPAFPLGAFLLGGGILLASSSAPVLVWLGRLVLAVLVAASVAVLSGSVAELAPSFLLWSPVGTSRLEPFLAQSAIWLLAGSLIAMLGTMRQSPASRVVLWLGFALVLGASLAATVFVASVRSQAAVFALYGSLVAHAGAIAALFAAAERPRQPQAARFLLAAAACLPLVPIALVASHTLAPSVQAAPLAAIVALGSFVALAAAATLEVRRRELAHQGALESIASSARDHDRCEESAGLGTWRLDRSTFTVELSHHAARILRADQYRGPIELLFDGTHPDDFETVAAWRTTIERQTGRHCATFRALDNGSARWIELRAYSPALAESPVVFGTVRDLTDQVEAGRAAQEELSLLRAVAQTTPDIEYVYDLREDHYVYSNRPIGELFGRPGYMSDSVMLEHVTDESRGALLEHYQEVNRATTDDVFEVDFEATRSDQETVWIRNRLFVFRRDGNGEPLMVAGTAQDVTARRRLRARLEDSEARFERISARAPGVIYQFAVATDGQVSMPYVSESCFEVFGVTADEVRENPMLCITMVHNEDRPGVVQAIEQSRADLTDYNWTGRVVKPNGDVVWVQASSRPTRLDDGTTVWDGIAVDVTEPHTARLDLARLKERLDFLLAESATVVYGAEPDIPYRIDFVASNVRSLIGFVPEQVVGRPLFDTDLVHEADRDAFAVHQRRFVDHGRSSAEYRLKTISGDHVWVRDDVRIVSTAPDRVEVVGAWTDVTDIRLSMERTLESQARLQRLAAKARGMLFELVLHEETKPEFTYVSPGSYDLVGLTAEEVRARPEVFLRMIVEEDRTGLYRDLARSRHEMADVRWTGKVNLPDGEVRQIRIEARPVEDHEHRVIWAGFANDHTGIAELSRSLDESEVRFAAVVNSLTEAVLLVDDEGTIIGANPSAEALFGALAHELVGAPASTFFPDGNSPVTAQNVGRRLDQRLNVKGSEVPVAVTVASLPHQGGQQYAGLFTRIEGPARPGAPSRAVVEPIAVEPPPQTQGPKATLLVMAAEGRADELEDQPGFTAVVAATAGVGLEFAKRRPPDLIVVAEGLPDGDAVGVVEAVAGDPELRNIPIFVLATSEQTALRLARLGTRTAPDWAGLKRLIDLELAVHRAE